jgi:iron complex outermembrane receptor protein
VKARSQLAAIAAWPATLLSAQSPTTNPVAAEGGTVQLDVFTVSTSADVGYRAANSVSATRMDTPIKDLPFAVSAFPAQFIADVNARDLWDVVQYAPGVTSAGKEFTAGNAVYTIRGFDQKPQRNGFAGDAYVDTVAIERIEVVKGPASLLYGQVSPGGTVNYITKRAQAKPFAALSAQWGTEGAARTTLDLNRPAAGGKLLLRLNAAWENLGQYWSPMRGQSGVLAPNLVWHVNPRVSLSVDYQWFHRAENPGGQLKPQTAIVAPASSGVVLGATSVLAKPDNSDFGLGPYFPLPADFSYVSNHDSRVSDFQNVNAEFRMKLSDHWVLRGNVNGNRGRVVQKLTGIAQVNITVPAQFYPAGTALPLSAADYVVAARRFADALLANPTLALDAPQAQQVRRKRWQEERTSSWAGQVDAAGAYRRDRTTRVGFLVGFSRDRTKSFSRTRQSDGTVFPNFVFWDMKNPGTWDRTTDFDPSLLPLSIDTRNVATNAAGYGVVNGAFFGGKVNFVAGARYNESSGLADNWLVPATSVGKIINHRVTPQIGISGRFIPAMTLYANYSQSYVLNATDLQRANVPSGPAAPTTAAGYELGAKTDFLDGRVSATVSAYQIDQRNRVLRFVSFGPGGASLNNILQGTVDRSRGLEGEVTWSPFDYWQVFASAAVDDVRVKQVPAGEEIFLGSHPEASVKPLANLWTRYNFPAARGAGWWAGGGFNYAGLKAQRLNNPRLFLPATLVWNAALGYSGKWAGHEYSALLSVQNISNREYYPANQQRGFPRRIALTLTGKY